MSYSITPTTVKYCTILIAGIYFEFDVPVSMGIQYPLINVHVPICEICKLKG